MRAPNSTIELLDLVRKSGIYPGGQLDARLKSLSALPDDPGQSAAVLVQKGMLTKFQAKLLLTGRYRGFKLGSYVIREQIGQGGMGAVYLAEHETLRRKVAIKVLTPVKNDPNAELTVERFLREARSVAALDHPNIVRVHDVAKQGDIHYLVMEYVDGQSLEEVLKKGGPIPASRAVEYIAQAAAGLQHAYEKKFIHRDVKPANLMLAKDGTVKLLDLGLARSAVGDNDKLTERLDEGAIVGTADFISPEQALNMPDIDIRSDVYSLGATFFALVTGNPPFNGNTTQKLMQHQMKDAPSLTSIDRTFPPALSRVVAKMLQKKPQDRYQTPGDVITAVAEWLPNAGAQRMVVSLSGTDLANSAEMQSTLSELSLNGTERFSKSKRLAGRRRPRWPLFAGIGASVAVALGAAVALGLFGGKEKDKTPPTAGGNPTPNPVPNPAPTPAANPTPAAGRTVVQRFDAADVPEFRLTTQDGATADGDRPTLPAGWRVESYGTPSAGEFRTTQAAGRPALAVGNRDGKGVAQLVVSSNDTNPKCFAANHGYEVRVEYKLDPGVVGRLNAQLVAEWKMLGGIELKAGDGWQTAALRFTVPADTALQVTLANPTPAADKFLYIGRVQVTDLGPLPGTGPAALRFAADDVPPFRLVLRKVEKQAGDYPRFPRGWRCEVYENEAVGEFKTVTADGRPALAMSCDEGKPSTQLVFAADKTGPWAFEPGRTYELRVEYKIDAGVNGQVQAQTIGDWQQLGIATFAAGGWQTAGFRFTAPPTGEVQLTVGSTTLAAGKYVYVRKLEVTEAGAPPTATPPAAAEGGAVAAVDFVGREEFRFTVKNHNPSPDPAEHLPAGVSGRCWKPQSVAEFRVGETAGRPAVAVTNLNDTLSSQLQFELTDLAAGKLLDGKSYRLKLTYRTTGDAAGRASVRRPKDNYARIGETELRSTNGEWKTATIDFTAPAGTPTDLVVENTTVGEGNALAVAKVEVMALK